MTPSIAYRIKCKDSATEKQKKKNYENPFREMTDILGFRIVVFLDSEVALVEKQLRECFHVDSLNSIDKRQAAHVREVGYRSLHLIANLGSDRGTLPEYSGLVDIPFEIQVRTALEHTWAEIEHRQNYKSSFDLPTPLQRRLMVLSGTLELVDRELSNIVADADEYARRVAEDRQETHDDLISVTSLRAVAESFAEDSGRPLRVNKAGVDFGELIEELSAFGVTTVSEIRDLLDRHSKNIAKGSIDESFTVFGICRLAMILEDHKKYFEEASKNDYIMYKEDAEKIAKILGPVDIHREAMMTAARCQLAA